MGAYSSLATAGLNYTLEREAQKQAARDARRDREQTADALRRREAETARQQQQALSRRLAEERARAGASGTATRGGSIDAILRGLEDDASSSSASRQRDLTARLGSLDSQLSERNRRNLLAFNQRWLNTSLTELGSLSGSRRNLLG